MDLPQLVKNAPWYKYIGMNPNINYKLFKMGKIPVTVQLNVQYIKPVNSGKIIGESFILHIGDKIAIGQGQVLNEDEERIAYGSATYYILKK